MRRPPRSAFTLIEVLATLTLAGIILPAVVRGIHLSLEVAGDARDRTEAVALARDLMAELIAAGDTQDGESSGDFGEAHPRFRWEARWDEWAEDNRLAQLEVTVTWTRHAQQRSVSLTTLAYEGGGR